MTDIDKHEPGPMALPLAYKGLNRVARIPSCIVSLEGLRRLYRELNEKTQEALEKELASFKQLPDQSPQDFDAFKENVRKVGGLTVAVIGERGEQRVATTIDALSDENLPEKIRMITFDSSAALRFFNYSLSNRFRLIIDFSEPPVLGAYDSWGQPTPNGSILEVDGPDTTWATAVYEYTLSFFKDRRKKRGWLHSQITFCLLNWFVGLPGALWIIFRLDNHLVSVLKNTNGVIRGAVYVYVVILVMLLSRMIIAGFRWIFPLIELEGARSNKTRGVLGTVLGSLVLALLYDVLKTILWP